MRLHPAILAFAFVASSALAVGVPAGPTASDALIQPGAPLDDACTLGYVFRFYHDSPRRFVSTAAQCVGGVGERVSARDVGEFGVVVYAGDYGGVERNGIPGIQVDFALVEVDASLRHLVVPSVKGHPDAPGRHNPPAAGSGSIPAGIQGAGVVGTHTTLQRMPLVTEVHGIGTTFEYHAPVVLGDIGAPVWRKEPLARPIGLVGDVLGHACCLPDAPPASTQRWLVGPSIWGMWFDVEQAGWPVRVATASEL